MAFYKIAFDYYSAHCVTYGTGPLEAGRYIDLPESAAAEFNADSPGVLVAVDLEERKPTPPPAPPSAPETDETTDDDTEAKPKRRGRPRGTRNRQAKTGDDR